MVAGGAPMNAPVEPVALVTAAGSGIGEGIARALAETHSLVLFGPSESVERLADEIGAIAVRGSLTRREDLERVVTTTLETHGRLDAVAVNTGHPPSGELLELTREDWDHGLDLIFHSAVELARLVTPAFQRQGGGAMAFVTSYATLTPELRMPVSSVLRGALQNWVKLYANRYGAEGIRANSVLPGFVDTHPNDPDRIKTIPAGRYADPLELGRVVSFLLSDAASFVSGQNIVVDGGMIGATAWPTPPN